jgi:hypothetical protein
MLSWAMGTLAVSIEYLVVCFWGHIESNEKVLLALFPNLTQNLMQIFIKTA